MRHGTGLCDARAYSLVATVRTSFRNSDGPEIRRNSSRLSPESRTTPERLRRVRG